MHSLIAMHLCFFYDGFMKTKQKYHMKDLHNPHFNTKATESCAAWPCGRSALWHFTIVAQITARFNVRVERTCRVQRKVAKIENERWKCSKYIEYSRLFKTSRSLLKLKQICDLECVNAFIQTVRFCVGHKPFVEASV